MDAPGPSIVVSGPYEEFFKSAFGVWIGGNHFSYGCCRPIGMHEVWMYIGLRQNRVE